MASKSPSPLTIGIEQCSIVLILMVSAVSTDKAFGQELFRGWGFAPAQSASPGYFAAGCASGACGTARTRTPAPVFRAPVNNPPPMSVAPTSNSARPSISTSRPVCQASPSRQPQPTASDAIHESPYYTYQEENTPAASRPAFRQPAASTINYESPYYP